jgi:N-acetylmuramoyl-L-alanine amidase
VAEALAAEGAAAAELRQVTGDRVNMRAGPGTGFDVVGQLTAGQMAEVIEADGNWLRVRGEDGAEGWMSSRFLAPAFGG